MVSLSELLDQLIEAARDDDYPQYERIKDHILEVFG